MKDKYGRTVDYIRISLTDKCNLRCIYCMPSDGNIFFEKEENLNNDEIYKIVKESAKLGIRKVRLTGGEPLVRKDINELIEKIYLIDGIEEIALTTNGMLLEERLEFLHSHGVKSLNISLDTLNEEKFKYITRGGDIHKVFRSIEKSLKLGIKIKINTVVIEDINKNEIIDLINFTKDRDISLRFIELMPIGEGKKFKGVSNGEIMKIIEDNNLETVILERNKKDGPAKYIKIKDYKGKIGFISAMSNCFCEDCNRIRITTDGMLKKCLNWKSDINLKKVIREGKEEKLLETIKNGIYNKPKMYLFNKQDSNEENRNMNEIGG
ncbi:molybdenum cofactor biosynthesis protein A [Clostridium thermobutyricum]|uniref:GTP 3',8-cyclase n=1 Tax=Clostridium thermobutyricum TaxID=29372 RepID=N9WJV2_9CLOT|nr:molybdenum cofactor biosynthesis protein A [Clostridium thermobutyricum]